MIGFGVQWGRGQDSSCKLKKNSVCSFGESYRKLQEYLIALHNEI